MKIRQLLIILIFLFALIGLAGSSVVGYYYFFGQESVRLESKTSIDVSNLRQDIDRTHPITVAMSYHNLPSETDYDFLENAHTEIQMDAQSERFEVAEVTIKQNGFLDDSLISTEYQFTLYKDKDEKWYVSNVKVIRKYT